MLLRLLRTRVRPYRRLTALLVVLQLVQILGTLLLPTLGAAVIDNGVLTGDRDYVTRLGSVMVAVALVQVVAALGAVSLASRTAMAMGRDIRSAVFRRVLDFSAREVGRFGTPSLLTRTVNDVHQVQTLAQSGFGIVVAAPLMCLGSVALALQQDVPLALILVVLVVVVAVAFGLLLARMGALYGRMQTSLDRLGRLLREQISGVRAVRSFVRDGYERERFTRTSRELYEVSQRVARLIASMLPVVLLLMNVFMVSLLWVGAHRIDSGAMRIGALSAFLMYLSLILMSVVMVAFVFLSVPRARVSAARIQEVLDTETSVSAPARPRAASPDAVGRVELRGAEFRYPGAEKPVLQDIDLMVGVGENLAVLGSTGSGKSTLLNLVLRQFDATGGSVRVSGVDVRQLEPEALCDTVGFVPQRPFLFSGTVASNLRFGAPAASDEELWHALRVAQADTFVAAMPGGLDAEISQGGTNVSGGQRQRLAIARALVRRPAVYLFDDCFSALDHATDAALRTALAPETARSTVITVAQRVASVRDADRIVILDGGRVVGTGTHEELLRDSPTYREIALSQLTEEETAHGLVGRP
ncbi:multidrug ABC transporter ATPase [Streptomyces sp. CB00316]|uniref:ABC transporter ATP-binding protein n=1 Tax=Streptomyces sp. CB00316 TaxID=1703932 RepID=UPI000939BF21|nr:ABC transporter ATP-binding protein [Streptomyces sp. CB00316]OKJ21649.1 multidrug ABC transporter ATPase [Streptomyces sp. CB00316]